MSGKRPAILRMAPPWAPSNPCGPAATAGLAIDSVGSTKVCLLHFAPQMRMNLVAGDCISDPIAFTGVYELAFTRVLVEIARKPGGLLVDVGANLGYFSLLWAAQRADNQAIAFEASPRNVPLLVDNLEANGLGGRVQVAR